LSSRRCFEIHRLVVTRADRSPQCPNKPRRFSNLMVVECVNRRALVGRGTEDRISSDRTIFSQKLTMIYECGNVKEVRIRADTLDSAEQNIIILHLMYEHIFI